jgi:MFS family permease
MPGTTKKTPVAWARELPILVALFLDLAAFGMVFPDVQLHARELGASGPVIGGLLASMFLIQILVSPLWGSYSDAIGRKPVFLFCTLLSASSWLVYAFSNNLLLILISRILAGLAAANVVVAQAYLSDVSSGDRRAATLGRAGAAISSGLILGPAIGLTIAAHSGIRTLGIVAACCSTAAVLAGTLMAEPAERAKTSKRKPFGINFSILKEFPRLRSLAILATVAWLALATLEGTFGRLVTEHYRLPETIFGYIFSMESLLGALVQGLLLGWVVSRLKERWTLRIGFALTGIGLILTPFAPAVWLLFLFSGLYAIGTALSNPTLNSAASRLVSNERQGELFGVLQGSRSIGFLVGPLIGGAIFDRFNAGPYLLAGSIALVAATLIPGAAD